MKRIPLIRLLVLGALVALCAAILLTPSPTSAAQGLSNAQVFALRYDVGVNQRAAVAVAKQAAFVIAGGGDQTTLPRAEQVMNNPEAEREKFIWYIVLNTTFQGAQTDANMEAVVATHYDEIWAPED